MKSRKRKAVERENPSLISKRRKSRAARRQKLALKFSSRLQDRLVLDCRTRIRLTSLEKPLKRLSLRKASRVKKRLPTTNHSFETKKILECAFQCTSLGLHSWYTVSKDSKVVSGPANSVVLFGSTLLLKSQSLKRSPPLKKPMRIIILKWAKKGLISLNATLPLALSAELIWSTL